LWIARNVEVKMSVLNASQTLNRLIRQDANTHLGEPTRPFLEEAVRAGRIPEAEQWLDYYLSEQAAIWNIFGIWDWHMAHYYLERKGDSAWGDLLRQSLAPWVGTTAGLAGQPLALVEVDGRSARLSVTGLGWVVHLIERDQRFELTLDAPETQAVRWTAWRADIKRTIETGNFSGFQKLLDAYLIEARLIHDILCDWAWALLTVIAREWGEANLGEVLRVTEEPWVTPRYEKLRDMSVSDSLQLTIEGMRGHFSGPARAGTITVTEEAERYVLVFDACGTGGRMRRGDPTVGSGSRLDAPYHFLNVEGAYDWTWKRKGVCAYCAHCAVVNQILPIEGLGRPMRMTLYPDNPHDPCRWVIYKNPQNYPDEAYHSVGKTRQG
jgi:hypothetical protein